MKLKFNHVHYRSSNLEATKTFYCGVLGGEFVGGKELSGRTHLHIKLGGQSLFFAPNPDENPREAESATERLGVYHIAFEVDDHDKAVAFYKERGAKFVSESLRPSPDLKVAFIEAPDGMQVELMEILVE